MKPCQSFLAPLQQQAEAEALPPCNAAPCGVVEHPAPAKAHPEELPAEAAGSGLMPLTPAPSAAKQVHRRFPHSLCIATRLVV